VNEEEIEEAIAETVEEEVARRRLLSEFPS
jgi:hypothetical protein